MSNTCVFIRHGSTSFNERGVFIGTLDVPLSVIGVRQALALRDAIREMSFDAVYSSPLLRAYHTATIALGMAEPLAGEDGAYRLRYEPPAAGAHCLPIVIDARIAERSFGVLQGRPHGDLARDFPEYEGRNVTKSFHDCPDGGESFADVEARVTGFLAELSARHEGAHIAVFSHNGPIRVARKILQSLSEPEALAIDNAHCEPIVVPM